MEPPEESERFEKCHSARIWFTSSDDLPEGEIVVPVLTKHGVALVVRPGEQMPRLLQALNETMRLLIDTGLWQPGDDGDETPQEE